MITLDIPVNEEKVIQQASEQFGMSVEDFFRFCTYDRAMKIAQPQHGLLTDLWQDLPQPQLTVSGTSLKQHMRDEWDRLDQKL